MPLRNRIVALIIALVFVVVGLALMIQRIGDVIGWDNAGGGWWIIALLAVMILLTAFLIYRSVRNKLNR